MADDGEGKAQESANRSRFAIDWDAARPAVLAQLLAGIGSFHDAEDVLQEVAISLAENYDKYDPSRPFVRWALGFARLHVLRYYERCANKRMLFDAAILESIGDRIAETITTQTNPRSEALFHCLAALDTERRKLVELRYASDLSIEDLSRLTKKSTSAVKGALHRARLQLKACVERRLAFGNES